MLASTNAMKDGEQYAENGDQRPNLHHGPGRPVQRHEVLAVAELQRHERKHLHDYGHDRDESVDAAYEHALSHRALVLWGSGRVSFDRVYGPRMVLVCAEHAGRSR